MEKIGPWGCCA